MEDKEERILITKCSSYCHALRINCDPFDDDDGMYCVKSGKWVRITEKDCAKCKNPVLLGLSRSEVIEKIAKAICEAESIQSCDECIYNGTKNCETMLSNWNYKELAEAALNALLEGHNDAR